MKNLKKILCLLLLTSVMLVSGCQKEEQVIEEEQNSSTPLFYKITKDKSDTTIYLLGSIHAADETAYPLPEKVTEAFNESEYLAVEVDIVKLTEDFDAQISLAQKMMYSDGTTIKEHIGEELYNSMVEVLKEKSSYSTLYDSYKPAFFESLFENEIINDANMNSNDGIDMHFLNLAKEGEKQILEVESADFQYDLLLGFPDELGKLNLQRYVDDYDTSVEQLTTLYEAWKKGDIVELEKMLFEEDDTEYTEEQKKLIEDYNNALIIDRNYNMAKVLETYFDEEKNVFCVVGLGHIIGEEGIVQLLEKKGYIVEKISY